MVSKWSMFDLCYHAPPAISFVSALIQSRRLTRCHLLDTSLYLPSAVFARKSRSKVRLFVIKTSNFTYSHRFVPASFRHVSNKMSTVSASTDLLDTVHLRKFKPEYNYCCSQRRILKNLTKLIKVSICDPTLWAFPELNFNPDDSV